MGMKTEQPKYYFSNFLVKKCGFPEPEKIYAEVRREVSEWNNYYSFGKECEACNNLVLSGRGVLICPGPPASVTEYLYFCDNCGHQQPPTKMIDRELGKHCISRKGGCHYSFPGIRYASMFLVFVFIMLFILL